MSTQWTETLAASDVVSTSNTPSREHLSAYVEANSVQLSDLSGYSLFEITGEDAKDFLQGQFCNDIANVSAEKAQITGYCTPKGRLLALPTLIGFENGYRMLVNDEVKEAFIKRLSMYVLRSKVQIKPLEDWVALGITMPVNTQDKKQVSALNGLVGELPEASLSVATNESGQLLRWHDDVSGASNRARFLYIAPVEQQLALWNSSAGFIHRASHTWRLADISAGVPSITAGTVESFVPQMINLQLIDGLSFTKGCYPGQEIVARMQYLGKLKRHMQVFSLQAAGHDSETLWPTLKAGASLGLNGDENAGVVIDAMPASDGQILVLAVTKVTDVQTEFTFESAPLAPVKMPYELPTMEVA